MPTHKDLPDDRRDDTAPTFEALRNTLRAATALFMFAIVVLLIAYCVWVLAEVYFGPVDLQVQECSQVPVAQYYDVC